MSLNERQIEVDTGSLANRSYNKGNTLSKSQIDSLFQTVGSPINGYVKSSRNSNESDASKGKQQNITTRSSNELNKSESPDKKITYDYVLKALKKQEEFKEKYSKSGSIRVENSSSNNSDPSQRTHASHLFENSYSPYNDSESLNLINASNKSQHQLHSSRYILEESNNSYSLSSNYHTENPNTPNSDYSKMDRSSKRDTPSVYSRYETPINNINNTQNTSKLNFYDVNKGEIESVYMSSRNSVDKRRKSKDRISELSRYGLSNEPGNKYDNNNNNDSEYSLKKNYPELDFNRNSAVPPRIFEKEYKTKYRPDSLSRNNSIYENSSNFSMRISNDTKNKLSYRTNEDHLDTYKKSVYQKDFFDTFNSEMLKENRSNFIDSENNFHGSLIEKIKDLTEPENNSSNDEISKAIPLDNSYSDSLNINYRSINGSYVRYSPESSENIHGEDNLQEFSQNIDKIGNNNNSSHDKQYTPTAVRRNTGKIASISKINKNNNNKYPSLNECNSTNEHSYPNLTKSRNAKAGANHLENDQINYELRPKSFDSTYTKAKEDSNKNIEGKKSRSNSIPDEYRDNSENLDTLPDNLRTPEQIEAHTRPQMKTVKIGYVDNSIIAQDAQVTNEIDKNKNFEQQVQPLLQSSTPKIRNNDTKIDNANPIQHHDLKAHKTPILKSVESLKSVHASEKRPKKIRHRNVGIQCNVGGRSAEREKEKLITEISDKDLIIEQLNKKIEEIEKSRSEEAELYNLQSEKHSESNSIINDELSVALSQLRGLNEHVVTLEKNENDKNLEIEKLNNELLSIKDANKAKVDELMDQISYLSNQLELYRKKDSMELGLSDTKDILSGIYKDSIKVVKSFSSDPSNIDYIEKNYENFKNDAMVLEDNSEFIKTISRIESNLETSNLAITKGLETISKNINSLDQYINYESQKNASEVVTYVSENVGSLKSKIEKSLNDKNRRVTSFASTPTKLSVPPANNCDTLDLRLGKRNMATRPPIPKAFSQRPKRSSTGLSLLLKQGGSLIKKDSVAIDRKKNTSNSSNSSVSQTKNKESAMVTHFSSPGSNHDTLNNFSISEDSSLSSEDNLNDTPIITGDIDPYKKYGDSVTFLPKNSIIDQDSPNRSSIFFFVDNSSNSKLNNANELSPEPNDFTLPSEFASKKSNYIDRLKNDDFAYSLSKIANKGYKSSSPEVSPTKILKSHSEDQIKKNSLFDSEISSSNDSLNRSGKNLSRAVSKGIVKKPISNGKVASKPVLKKVTVKSNIIGEKGKPTNNIPTLCSPKNRCSRSPDSSTDSIKPHHDRPDAESG
ncbi:hypothetical protein AYI69_g4268 [Smittium culicis]|uniref:Uncharacterized protein n=1 Tax=Smittium culicis TaxID=133412 RepID=A0A1R1YEZ6_9FUNG|nr:hypothetical protein AYI69_g7573 [Smittium culicis]OMJ25498.1 hypothetical protein AYI69_g4268 [Smittium culicis]